MTTLPNFIVIGAMKAGTDALWEYLRAHPQVFMSETKELDYFAEGLNWSLGSCWYESQFDGSGTALAVGEASTSYAKYPLYRGVPERMMELLPSARMIYLVRNPVERMRSQFLHQKLLGEESDPVERALRVNPSYLDFSRYAYQLDQYLDVFPREHVLVLVSEELRSDRANAMARVYRFLGLGEESPPEVVEQEFHRTAEKRVLRPNFEALHRLPGYTTASRFVPGSVRQATLRWRTRGIDPSEAEISGDLRRELEAELAEDVARLRAFLGPGFDGWGIA